MNNTVCTYLQSKYRTTKEKKCSQNENDKIRKCHKTHIQNLNDTESETYKALLNAQRTMYRHVFYFLVVLKLHILYIFLKH